jgi:hypothetical protein
MQSRTNLRVLKRPRARSEAILDDDPLVALAKAMEASLPRMTAAETEKAWAEVQRRVALRSQLRIVDDDA